MCCKGSSLLFKINNKIWMTLPEVHRNTCRHLIHINFFWKKKFKWTVSYIVWYLNWDIFIFLCQRLLAVLLYTQYNGFNKNTTTKPWHKSVFLALRRWRQEDFQFEANLDPHKFCLQNQTENHIRAENSNLCWGCGETGILTHWWWECAGCCFSLVGPQTFKLGLVRWFREEGCLLLKPDNLNFILELMMMGWENWLL